MVASGIYPRHPQGERREPVAFVGRDAELRLLTTTGPNQHDGFRQLSLISGAVGTGKTRLLQEMAEHAERSGEQVIWATCWNSDTSPAYWPWLQVFRAIRNQPRAMQLSELLLETPDSAERFELFEAAARVLREHSARHPSVIVIDDLHEADAQSLLLARFLGQQLRGAPLQIVGATRPIGSAPDTEHGRQFVALYEASQLIELGGLSRAAVDLLLPDAGAAAAVHAASGGNPWYVEQLFRQGFPQDFSGQQNSSPDALISLTRNRLRHLPRQVHQLLTALAICEVPITLLEVAELCGISPELTRESVGIAIREGLIAQGGDEPFRSWLQFTHQIVAETVAQDAVPAEVHDLHRRRAEMLREHPVEHARHLLRSDTADLHPLFAAVLDAANESIATLAFEDTISLCLQAIAIPHSSEPSFQPTRVQLLLALGAACWQAGREDDSERAYSEAWLLARKWGDVDAQTRAAIGPEFRFDLAGAAAVERRERCGVVLQLLPRAPSMLRLKLTANLAASVAGSDPHAAAEQAAEVQKLAELLDSPVAEAYALAVQGLTDHSPDTVGVRAKAARRILAIVHRDDVPELASVGHFLLLTALLEQGDIHALDTELSLHGETVNRFPELHDSRHAQWFRCLRAILDGRTTLAEDLANELLGRAQAGNEAATRSIWAGQIGVIRWMQGRIFEMEPAFLAARQEHPNEQMWAISLAWMWQKQGRESAAQAIFTAFDDLDSIPRDRNWLVTVTALGELTSEIGSVESTESLRDALLPYATQVVPIGLGLAFWGTVAKTLGMLAKRLGRDGEARIHFRTAIDVCTRTGAQAWLAEAQLELAELELGTFQNLTEARQLANQALATADALDFPALSERARAALAKLPPSPEAEDPHGTAQLPARRLGGSDRARIRVLGAFDVVSHTGIRAQWTSRKARELVKLLVSRRGIITSREVFMEHLWPGIHPEQLGNRFAVALSTVRRALDPDRELPTQHFVIIDGEALRLNIDALHIDTEEFFTLSRKDDTDSLRQAAQLYTGDAFPDEPYAEWATALRHDAQTTFCTLARTLAMRETESEHHLAASQLFRRVIDIDQFNHEAYSGLIASLTMMGAHGQARAMEAVRARLLDDLAG